jgi:hypothetical protein
MKGNGSVDELTQDDIALAIVGLALAINWHRAQPKTDCNRGEIEKLAALQFKMNRILDGEDIEPIHSAPIGTVLKGRIRLR